MHVFFVEWRAVNVKGVRPHYNEMHYGWLKKNLISHPAIIVISVERLYKYFKIFRVNRIDLFWDQGLPHKIDRYPIIEFEVV